MAQTLEGQIAIVTGAGRRTGIGYSIAMTLAERGASVVVTDLGRRAVPDAVFEAQAWADLSTIADELQQLGGGALAVKADVTNADEVQALVDQTVAGLGGIDILVNNAGICITKPVLETTLAEWELVQRVNATSTFLCSSAAARAMIARGRPGSIVNMSSISGKEGWPNFGAYTASKFAVLGFTQTLARELAPHGIRVNAVCPGLVDTAMNAQIVAELSERRGEAADSIEDDQLRRVPLRRYATPEDVANTVAFLVSPEAAYITGQAINVDGGLMVAR